MIILKDILNVVFPAKCVVCGESFYYEKQNVVCKKCVKQIRKRPVNYCKSCGKPTLNCQDCLKERKYEYIEVFTKATPEVINILAVYKLKKIKFLAEEIAEEIKDDLIEFVKKNSIELITFIPLDRWTEKEREFNHLKEILKFIFPSYMVLDVLEKTKKTHLQMNLSRKERLENLRDAFSLKEDIKDKRVLVFDDILTTGATMIEAFKTLKKGKPKKIYGYVIAR